MSGLKRFFTDKIEDVTTLSGEEFLHAVNVLRIRQGDFITLLDNTDFEYEAEVAEVGKKSLSAKVVSKKKSETESKNKIKLICGFLKGDKTEYAVQKAVELGVYEITVFESEFSSAYLSPSKVERLSKVSKEAAKQCGRSRYPLVTAKNSLAEALVDGAGYANKLFACEFAHTSDIDLKTIKGDTAVVIGSEGGFSEKEFEAAKGLGYKGITLGKRILRADTASIVMCGLISFINGELE